MLAVDERRDGQHVIRADKVEVIVGILRFHALYVDQASLQTVQWLPGYGIAEQAIKISADASGSGHGQGGVAAALVVGEVLYDGAGHRRITFFLELFRGTSFPTKSKKQNVEKKEKRKKGKKGGKIFPAFFAQTAIL